MPNDAVDTSREAVERDVQTVVAIFDEDGEGLPLSLHSLTEKCRALLARAERAEKLYSEAQGHADHWAKERDAAVAEAARLTAEVASLRLTLGGKTFSASVPEPVGCPMPGACATVAEIVRAREMQAAWLRVIQAENTCGVTGKPCDAVRCGCSAEQEMLIGEER